MEFWEKVVLISVIFICTASVNGMADEISLKNGDRITGTVVKMENNTLTFKTSYAGEISVTWEEIASIETDLPIDLVLSDDTFTRGMVAPSEKGKLIILAPEPVTIDLAQVKGINPGPPEPALKIKARVNAGLDVKTGNTDTENYALDGEIVARSEKNRYTVGGDYTLEKADGDKTAENARGYTKYDRFLTEKWYLYGHASFETDEFTDLDLRTIFGAGSGYQFYETELRNLSFEAGLSYVIEDFDEGKDDEYPAARWSVNYDEYFFDKVVQFFHVHAGFISLEDSSDVLIRSKTGFRIPFHKYLNLTAQYNLDWDNNPAPGDDELDQQYLLTVGFQYE